MSRNGTFNALRFREIIRPYIKRGWKAEEMARASGVTASTFSKLRSGKMKYPDDAIVQNLATFLHLPKSVFLLPDDPDWHYASQFKPQPMNETFDVGRKAEVILSLSSHFSFYMTPKEMSAEMDEHLFRPFYSDDDEFQKRLELARSFDERRRTARESHDYVIKNITPVSALQLAINRGKPEWIDEIIEGVNAHQDNSPLGLLDEKGWREVRALVRENVLDVPWTKINVSDNKVAIVFTATGIHWTYNWEKVKTIRQIIEVECAKKIPYHYPLFNETLPQMNKHACHMALKQIKNDWLRIAQKNPSQPESQEG